MVSANVNYQFKMEMRQATTIIFSFILFTFHVVMNIQFGNLRGSNQ